MPIDWRRFRRLAAWCDAILLAYGSIGLAVFTVDRARGWCDLEKKWQMVVVYAVLWPLRFMLPAGCTG